MTTNQYLMILCWWLALGGIGWLAYPISERIFRNFFDRGYLFSKVLGLGLFGYGIWLITSLRVLPFSWWTILGFLVAAAVLRLVIDRRIIINKIILLEELLFLVGLVFWLFIRGLQPNIQGLEKFMDFGFVNAILRSDYFPPADMWYAGKTINYYYFGHYLAAFLTKLTGIPSSVTYNLMIATLFSLAFCLVFSLGANLIYLSGYRKIRHVLLGGVVSAALVVCGGNLHALIYAHILPWAKDKGLYTQTVKKYWYPDSTRYIGHNPPTEGKTIHEFPVYGFVVSDLHGHLSDIPFVLTLLGVLLALISRENSAERTWRTRRWWCLLLGFLLAIMYMTNTWDFPIYFLTTAGVLWYSNTTQNRSKWKTAALTGMELAGISAVFLLAALPYLENFTNFAKGWGWVMLPSPKYQLLVLWGYQLFFLVLFWAVMKGRPYTSSDLFIWVLSLAGLTFILVPETVYLKDIYGSSFSRANTVFKLTFQSFIMLGLVAGYAAVRIALLKEGRLYRYGLGTAFAGILVLPMVYPYHAVKGYYGKVALSRFKQLDGLKFLAPGDAKAIDWLKTNVTGQPTILEADGKSYTQYGRISMATGLPTVLGWFVHEWLWRGDYKLPDERVKDVSKLYCTVDPKVRRDLLKKYGIKYIIVGKLERTKFKWVKDREILKFGKVVFDADGTKIIQVNEGLTQNPTTRSASSQPFWVPVTKKAQGVLKPVTKPVQTRPSNLMQRRIDGVIFR